MKKLIPVFLFALLAGCAGMGGDTSGYSSGYSSGDRSMGAESQGSYPMENDRIFNSWVN